MPKGNPNPKKPRDWDKHKKPKHATQELAPKIIGVRFSVETDAVLRAMGDEKSEFIRRAVDAAIAELDA